METIPIIMINKINGIESLTKNRGINFTLSCLVCVDVGLEDPFSCSSIKWTNTRAMISIGRRKCNEKKRVKVGWDTEDPPQIQVTRSFPTSGMAVITPVITVAPQNDICLQGRT